MNAIDISAIYKNYNQLQALKNIDLTIQSGEFFGLLGSNGAGKTTLISILAGLVRASAGQVKIMGHDVIKDFAAARRALGVVPQEIVFDPFFTVRETLKIQSGYFGLQANDAWIDEIMFNLDLTNKADTNMRALSGGMKRRVLVAQAIVHKPPVILLDEPTAGVDVELRQALWKFISRLNREGHTIVLTTHYLEEAQNLCTRIAMLKQGQIIALDQTQHLLERFASLQLVIRVQKDTMTNEILTKITQEACTQYIHADSNSKVEGERTDWITHPTTKQHDLSNVVPESPQTEANKVMQTKWKWNQTTNQLHWRLSSYDQIEPILALCRSHKIKIEDVELQKADLEDVFVQLINR